MKKILWLIRAINGLNDCIGKATSMLIFLMIFALLWEVLMRYVFHRPTVWAHEFSTMVYAVFFLLGGAYALRWNSHVNVEIIYEKFSPKTKAAVDLLTWSLFYFFYIVMLWKGATYAWTATMRLEKSSTIWGPPIWPIKLFIPISALLFLLQGLSKTLSDVVMLLTGRDVIQADENDAGPSQ